MLRSCRIVIVDRAPLVRAGLTALLSGHAAIEVVGRAENETTALKIIAHSPCNVGLIGAGRDRILDTELIREIHKATPWVRCIALSPEVDDALFFRAVVAGAVGFLIEDLTGHELQEAALTVAAGGSMIDAAAIDALRARMAHTTVSRGLPSGLTGQEQRIAWLVVQGATNSEVATDLGLAEKTVRNYMSSILAKSGVRNRTELAARAIHSSTAKHASMKAGAPRPR